ncbi:hypothetical protein LSCM1_02823 [Leishmania martiniquensis]|uniref:Flagellar attachment zone protein 1 conserved domain-containing protein n=1 Tax=Leishmania martiniquensis TaxID=1580590 RepID=A0A836GKY0_9TRYP|nr:hypothetical protein LSCM1_02823 [Leishmania martiniquensis]
MQELTSDVCDATALQPASVQQLVLTVGSLIADFELAHDGLSAERLDEQLADAPFTRTWVLYQRHVEREATPVAAAAPLAALHESESFMSLETEEQPPAPHRVGTPEELLPAVQQGVAPLAALCDAESFMSLEGEPLQGARQSGPPQEAGVPASVETPPARELAHRPSELQGYSRYDLADAESAVLHEQEEEAPRGTHVATLAGAPARLTVTKHRVRLEGDAWAGVLLKWRDLLMQELTSDVCDATALQPASVQQLVLTVGSLIADFELAHDGLSAERLDEQLADAPFTRTWVLYQRHVEREATPVAAAAPLAALHESESFMSLETEEQPPAPHRVGTPEELLPAVQQGVAPLAALCDAESFMSLEGEPLQGARQSGPPQEAGVPASVETPPARELAHRPSELQGYSRYDLADAESAVLHEQEEEAPRGTHVATLAGAPARLTVTKHRVRLEGDAWAGVLLKWRDLLMQELTSDVCDATALQPASVQQLVLTVGSLIADFELAHDGLSAERLDEQLADAPFTRTWVLYQRHVEREATPVAAAAPLAALHESESFMSLETEEQPPAPHRVGTPEELLPAVQQGVAPLAALCDAESFMSLEGEPLQGARQSGPPQEAGVPASVETPPARELAHRPSELQGYSRYDLADAESAVLHEQEEEPSDIYATKSAESSRLIVGAGLRVLGERQTESMAAADDSSVVTNVPDEAVSMLREWSVEERSTEALVTHHSVKLRGRYWFMVCSSPLVAESFEMDVANALGVSRKDVQHLVLVPGSLVGAFDVVHTHDALTASAVDDVLRVYPFPLTWRHYPVTQETTVVCLAEGERDSVTDENSRNFDCASNKESAPANAELLLSDSGERKPHPPLPVLEDASKSVVSSCGRTYSAPMTAQGARESLTAPLMAGAAFSLTEKEGIMSSSPTPAVLEDMNNAVNTPSMDLPRDATPTGVAETAQSPEPQKTLSTKHRVGFVGHRWTTILKMQRDDFVAAFRKGTGEKLGVEPDSVDKVQCNDDTGDTIVTFHVTHSSALPSKRIDLLLRSAPYSDVWKLYYENAPPESQEEVDDGVATFHRVGFVGSKWKDLISRDLARFNDAFVADTATALSVTPQAVKIADYAVADDIVVDFYVAHAVTGSEELIDAKLEQFDYQHVWELYGTTNEVDEQQRVVPCVMKRSPTSHRTSPSSPALLRMPLSSSLFPVDGFCPSCRRRFSPQQELPQLGNGGGWYPQPVHSHASSVGDTVRATLTEGNSVAFDRPSPLPPVAKKLTPRESWELQTWQPPNVQRARGTSLTRGAQTAPRAPWYPSGNTYLVPHPPRRRSPSKTKRRRQRRIDLRELESELSRKQRQRKHQERQEQLDREMRRSLNCSRSSLPPGTTANLPRSFLPPIPARYTKVRPGLQHMNGPGYLME